MIDTNNTNRLYIKVNNTKFFGNVYITSIIRNNNNYVFCVNVDLGESFDIKFSYSGNSDLRFVKTNNSHIDILNNKLRLKRNSVVKEFDIYDVKVL